MVTSLTFGMRDAGNWIATLERWREIWSTPDDHPNVVDAQHRPSALRAMFEESIGLDPVSWLAGVFWLCIRWSLAVDQAARLPMTEDELFQVDVGDVRGVLSTAFREVFLEQVTQDVDTLSAAARATALNGTYAGIGSLSQGDSLDCRNAPVLKLSDGSLMPLSIDLVVDRAIALYRLKVQGLSSRERNSSVGPLFEAYVADRLNELSVRHTVVTEGQIKEALDEGKRCDGVVGMRNHYLCVEVSLQTLARRIADGDADAIRDMAERYHAEADQAEATAEALHSVSEHFGLPAPHQVEILVVTEMPLAHTPALTLELGRVRSDRNPRFVCSVAELEGLVRLGVRGWDVPSVVANWQGRGPHGPLSTHMVELAELMGPHRDEGDELIRAWLSLLPLAS
jgi:hypothetical protein